MHDSDTKVWARSLTVLHDGKTYATPAGELTVEHGKAVDRDQITVEIGWEADDGASISVNFYTRHDGQEWWSYEVRTRVDYPEADGDWVFYPGDSDSFFRGRENGLFFRTPLGFAFEGQLRLDTLIIEDFRLEAFGAEFPVDRSKDVGDRRPRPVYLIATKPYRFETRYALLDADTFDLVVGGATSSPPSGEHGVGGEGSVGDSGYQNIGVGWIDPSDGVEQGVTFYFRGDESHWWIDRISVRQNDEPTHLEGIVVAKTAHGEVFEGDIITDVVEVRGVRLELAGCDGRPGLKRRYGCLLD